MKTYLYIFLLALSLPLKAICQIDTISESQKSMVAFVNGDFDLANNIMKNVLVKKSNPLLLNFMGDIQFALEKYSDAINYYKSAEKTQKRISHFNIAKAYIKINKIDSAFIVLNNYFDGYFNESSAKLSADNDFEILKQYPQWSTLMKKVKDNEITKQLEIAEYYINKNRAIDAFQVLNPIIKKHKNNHKAWFLRSCAYMIDNNYKSAIPDIEQALKLKHNNSEYLNKYADILFIAHKYSKSVEYYLLALKNNELLFDNFLKVSKAYFLNNRYLEAEKYSKLYLLLFPKNQESILIASESMAMQNNCIDALKCLNKSIEKDANFYRIRGLIYYKSEAFDLSINDFCKAIDLNNKLYDIFLWRGLAYYFNGNKDKAKSDWNLALKYKQYKANDYLVKYR
ncbi:MAG: hypothetical protein MJ211_07500 [Bacteroidales bacterium]|nr:hypothetical protein [Bacteroidales bacterium]